MSTIQADVLQLSRLSDGMLLKWCLQSVFFPLVTRRRQKWLEALPGCGSEPQEGGSPARWLAFLYIPVPSQLETRQLGNQCDAGLSTELRAWVHLVGSCEARRQWVSMLGSLSPQLVLEVTKVSPKFPRTRAHMSLLTPPLLLWSLLAVLPIELFTPKVHSKQACVSL